MEERGLQSSAWAPRYHGDASSARRSGDWTCPSCGFSNFQRRLACVRCAQPAANTVFQNDIVERKEIDAPHELLSAERIEHHWGHETPKRVTENIPKIDISSQPAEDLYRQSTEILNNTNGLSTSLWAPRSYTGRSESGRSRELYARVHQPVRASSSSPANTSRAISNATELSLPYDVQHYILAMIQRMLEEACYDFASRWIPNTLYENNWTCPEAVELSTWRKILPATIPPHAIAAVTNYPFETALADAIRIRNAAVHRHLCTDLEMKRSTSQAQDLMVMFADVTRQSKFHRLWIELDDWNGRSQQDPQAARIKLQEALQEISERPIDDMDWTPNAASGQETLPSPQSAREADVHYVESMEID